MDVCHGPTPGHPVANGRYAIGVKPQRLCCRRGLTTDIPTAMLLNLPEACIGTERSVPSPLSPGD